MENAEQLDLWQAAPEKVSIDDMDNAVKKLRDAKLKYDEAVATKNESYARYQDAQEATMALLKRAGKDEYTVKGFGKVSIKEELSVKTPKSPEEKEAFFNWIKDTMGDDAYFSYMTVNSNSLNSLYKQKVEEAGARGEILDVPGLEAPTSYTKLSLRKA